MLPRKKPRETPASRPGQDAPEADAAERWTVGRLLTWTVEYLGKHGSQSARLDAELLLAHALDWERVRLYTKYEEEVAPASRDRFRALVKQRAAGSPVAYLLGRKEFYSLMLSVTPDVLIPRPDSEHVVVEFLAATKDMTSPLCVDVGTGSGCLALACLKHHATARFVVIDSSAAAVEVARTNAAALQLEDRVEFRVGDKLDAVAGAARFDAIISNPPYIATDEIETLDPTVRLHEPREALDGGVDGLRVIEPLIGQAAGVLRPGGVFIVEIGAGQEGSVRTLFDAEPRFDLAPTVRDHANRPRVLRATRRTAV